MTRMLRRRDINKYIINITYNQKTELTYYMYNLKIIKFSCSGRQTDKTANKTAVQKYWRAPGLAHLAL